MHLYLVDRCMFLFYRLRKYFFSHSCLWLSGNVASNYITKVGSLKMLSPPFFFFSVAQDVELVAAYITHFLEACSLTFLTRIRGAGDLGSDLPVIDSRLQLV